MSFDGRRRVCKAEWAYETEIVFDSHATFKGYMDSDVRSNVVLPALEEIKPLLTDGPIYLGNRVSDDL